jgi:hypothetical protein
MLWKFKSCGKCGGDLILETDEWRCVHCGRYYYPNVNPSVNQSLDLETAQDRRGTLTGSLAVRSIGTLADAVEV